MRILPSVTFLTNFVWFCLTVVKTDMTNKLQNLENLKDSEAYCRERLTSPTLSTYFLRSSVKIQKIKLLKTNNHGGDQNSKDVWDYNIKLRNRKWPAKMKYKGEYKEKFWKG